MKLAGIFATAFTMQQTRSLAHLSYVLGLQGVQWKMIKRDNNDDCFSENNKEDNTKKQWEKAEGEDFFSRKRARWTEGGVRVVNSRLRSLSVADPSHSLVAVATI